MWGTGDELHLNVSDSGKGFNLDQAMNGRGIGLISMRERLRLVNGELLIKSEPNRGTTVMARIRLQPKDNG